MKASGPKQLDRRLKHVIERLKRHNETTGIIPETLKEAVPLLGAGTLYRLRSWLAADPRLATALVRYRWPSTRKAWKGRQARQKFTTTEFDGHTPAARIAKRKRSNRLEKTRFANDKQADRPRPGAAFGRAGRISDETPIVPAPEEPSAVPRVPKGERIKLDPLSEDWASDPPVKKVRLKPSKYYEVRRVVKSNEKNMGARVGPNVRKKQRSLFGYSREHIRPDDVPATVAASAPD
jgi:hypothetical protein